MALVTSRYLALFMACLYPSWFGMLQVNCEYYIPRRTSFNGCHIALGSIPSIGVCNCISIPPFCKDRCPAPFYRSSCPPQHTFDLAKIWISSSR
ncbi:hypothetical protein EDD85DRAFT_134415 [Armillaria nabsnona]|nr:hypothetical protein EDD85DRAFT_134415 [Armillaria nabsnona]